jgi:Fe-S-cluster containining protein
VKGTDVRLAIKLGGERVSIETRVPDHPRPSAELVPSLYPVADAVVGAAVRAAGKAGGEVSCRAGCGACCRQPVPIAEVEAAHLARVVAALPPARRRAVEARFRDAVDRLDRAGLTDRLRQLRELRDPEARQSLAVEYFRLGVACPFLEDESCSIHPNRPLACREYLVTSPAERCAEPSPEAIEMVDVPVKPSIALFRFRRGVARDGARSLVLTLLFDWLARHPRAGEDVHEGATWLEAFVRSLTSGSARATGPGDSRSSLA